MFRLLAVIASLTAAGAWADKPHISIVDFKGPKAAAVKKQLSAKLCKTFKCVKPGDGEDVAVSAIVTGAVDKKGAVSVAVYFDEEQQPITREMKLKAGKVPAPAFKSVTSAVKEAIASGTAPEDAASVALAGSP
ncbi:MAG: hypothetical protein IPJ65_39690 [Archangiaceae bacterium]|nr:hypothetical protein [Archangiaceae bacterium]